MTLAIMIQQEDDGLGAKRIHSMGISTNLLMLAIVKGVKKVGLLGTVNFHQF